MYFEHTITSGFIPPEAFLYFDKNGYIQNCNNVPIIYHYPRRNITKRLRYPPFLSSKDKRIDWRCDLSIPKQENLKKKKNKKEFWWLEDNLLNHANTFVIYIRTHARIQPTYLLTNSSHTRTHVKHARIHTPSRTHAETI
jgi:hypothetical protein